MTHTIKSGQTPAEPSAAQGEEKRLHKALLIATFHGSGPQRLVCEEHLEELELLLQTYGAECAQKVTCHLRKIEGATYIGTGKLEELVQLAKDLAVDLVVMDDELTPSQQRNLEKAFGIPVMERTEVILNVFAQRAQTKEARLQIELAQAKYQAPRLKRLWTHLSRQAGTGGGTGAYLKGEGEKQIEIDKRILKKKVDDLRKEIDSLRAYRITQRTLRERAEVPIFAIVGYTNAGKSTLLNALTGSQVFVEDKLFATLDTTTRKYLLPNNQEVLLIDTVGFIRKLPHLLVAAFRSTLEESIQADTLIHLIDVSHPMAEEQAEATYAVLKELKADEKAIITVFNKIDKCENASMINRMRIKYPKNVQISALNHVGFEELQHLMVQELQNLRKTVVLRIPQSDYSVVSDIMRIGHILKKEYDENDIIMHVSLPQVHLGNIAHYIVS